MSCYYTECTDCEWGEVKPVERGFSCENNQLIESTYCESPKPAKQCSFVGIKCMGDEGILIRDICTARYVECQDGTLTSPVALPGIMP